MSDHIKKNPTLEVKVDVVMRSKSSESCNFTLKKGSTPNLRFEGRFFPAQVVECEKIIKPGQSGILSLFMLDSAPDRSDIRKGSVVDLMAGPEILIASGKVLSVSKVMQE